MASQRYFWHPTVHGRERVFSRRTCGGRMTTTKARPGMVPSEVIMAGWKVVSGRAPMLSIEITRECPLTCPGCYAYGESHLGGEVTLRQLSDLRGDALVDGVV